MQGHIANRMSFFVSRPTATPCRALDAETVRVQAEILQVRRFVSTYNRRIRIIRDQCIAQIVLRHIGIAAQDAGHINRIPAPVTLCTFAAMLGIVDCLKLEDDIFPIDRYGVGPWDGFAVKRAKRNRFFDALPARDHIQQLVVNPL